MDKRGIHVVRGTEHFTEPPQDLRQDHSRVASGAHERTVRDRFADGIETGIGVERRQLANHRLHRERHVGSRVAVRHREYVELVDLVDSLFESGGGCGYERASGG